jgi:hypothetical protein
MFTITFLRPYTQDWGFQSFPTRWEADRMIEFYRSCGSPARMA